GSYVIPPTYTAVTVILPPQQQQSAAMSLLQGLGALGGLAGATAGLKNPSDQYVSFVKSRSVSDALVKRFDLKQRYEKEFTEDALKALDDRTRVFNGKDGLIVIEVDDHEPRFSAQLANGYVEELGRLLSRLAVTEAQQRRAFFERQIEQVKKKLNEEIGRASCRERVENGEVGVG